MVKAVIFDLDDTLISEKQYIISGYHHIAQVMHNRFKISEKEAFWELMKLFKESPKNVSNRFLDRYKIIYTKEIILNLVEEYRNHFPEICFYEDVLPCLAKLKSNNVKVGIITDGYVNAQRQKMRAVKAYDYFDEVIITEELGRKYWKPHPKAFEIMREKLDVEFNEMVYIGDNPEKDFYIGKKYPITTVRVLREGVYKDKAYLEDIKETYVINDLNEISLLITSPVDA